MQSAANIGIPYNTFMMMNPKSLNVYMEAYKQKMDDEGKRINYAAWLQGLYEIKAIGKAMVPNKNKYPQKPLGKDDGGSNFSKEEKFKLWIHEFNRRFEKK